VTLNEKMSIKISILTRAHKQQELINLLPLHSCKRIGNSVYISGVYSELKRVNDVYRYILQSKNGKLFIKKKFSNGIGNFNDQCSLKRANKSVVLVIESPHKDEYNKNYSPIAPAQGATGLKIEKYFCGIINKYKKIKLPTGNYDFIISNPVQFQTSLYHLHGVPLSSKNTAVSGVRDKIWKSIFPYEIKNFHSRISNYKPMIIINACTVKLKPLVNKELKKWKNSNKSNSNVKIFTANKHPCIWSSKVSLKK